jgi:Methyltransferase domain
MITPRWAGVVFAILGTMSLALMAWTDSLWVSTLGAGLFTGSVLLLALSFWRDGAANRRATSQRLKELQRDAKSTRNSLKGVAQSVQTLNSSINGVLGSVRTINDSMKYVTKASQTTINRLNDTASQIRILRELNSATRDRIDAFAEAILADIAQVQLDGLEHDSALGRLETELKRALLRANRDRDRVVGELHGIVALYSVFQPERPYPDFGPRSIAAGLAKHYVEKILRDRPRVVIEVGSGLSTLLSARALEEIGSDGHVFALEHERDWAELTKASLEDHGLAHRATILYAPLTEIRIESEVWKWYYLNNVDLPTGAQLLLIDGHPQSTGSPARYPALPTLIDYLTDDAVILVDDGIRQEEVPVVERWVAEIPGLNVVSQADRKETIEIRRVDE